MYICEGITPEIISSANRITIKIGSSLLINSQNGELNHDWFANFIKDVVSLHEAGKEIVRQLVEAGRQQIEHGFGEITDKKTRNAAEE